MILRDYQTADVARIRAEFVRGARKVLYCAPTGAGKTLTFLHAGLRAIEKGRRVAVVVHRIELVDQVTAALAAEGVSHGVVAAGFVEQPDELVQVCMAQTLARRLDRLQGVKLLVIDEAHHINASTWLAIVNACPNAHILGVTATPERLDGRGLDQVFETLIIGPSVKELIAAGWLCEFIVCAPERIVDLKRVRTLGGDYQLNELAERMNTEIVLSDVVAEFKKHLLGRTALAFCTTIDHSRATARFLRAAGIKAEHLDGDSPRAERREIIARLARGELSIITNCGLISEGLDVPAVAGCVLLRPTKSLALFLQMIGRALRPSAGKDRAVILDHSGNVYRHGMPDWPHAWSLAGRPKQKGKAPVKRCCACGALIPAGALICSECGAVQPSKHPPKPISAPLVELDPANAFEAWLAHGQFKAVVEWAGNDEARLRRVAEARGYQPGWVWHRLKRVREADDDALLQAVWK